MRVYTSYYGKAKNLCRSFACVRVSASMPVWFPMIAGELPEVFPSWELVNGLKSGCITEEEYKERYLQKMSAVRRTVVIRKLTEISGAWHGQDVLLLCWEKDGFCHRHILGEWLNIGVTELTDLDLSGRLV